MITRIEALNYRCLRYVSQPLGPFHVLVGPNASGKSTFLDVIALVRDIVSSGLEDAITSRAPNYAELFWRGEGERFEVAIEAEVPGHHLCDPPVGGRTVCRYEVAVGEAPHANELAILAERLWLRPPRETNRGRPDRFPACQEPPTSILANQRDTEWFPLLSEGPEGNCVFRSETRPDAVFSVKHGRRYRSRLASRRSALDYLPEDEDAFSIATWFKYLLTEEVLCIRLDPEALRAPCPPTASRTFRPDGANLPWLVHTLEGEEDKSVLEDWIGHVQTGLPEVRAIRSVVREEDRHCYLKILYENGVEVPSWLVSDGTLRMLALTLIAYLDQWRPGRDVYLIEQPENGIHPHDLETVYQSLTSIYDGQVLIATHSPVLLTMAELDQVLCFAKAPDGAADIVSGAEHPMLRNWRHQVSLGTYMASGVLG